MKVCGLSGSCTCLGLGLDLSGSREYHGFALNSSLQCRVLGISLDLLFLGELVNHEARSFDED